ncbi:MAG: PAS domain S-box protein, partial [Deltaproteobacteria bacterium]|nr:PAS domain S-box protein [Deltaproteobacteria bacterium]
MVNDTFLRMLNYTQEEVIGEFIVQFTAFVEGTYATTTGEEVIIDEECVNNTGSRSAELFEKGYIKNWETYFVRKDKVHVPVDATLSVMKDKGGERRGSIVVLRDITERRSAEIENKKSRDFLENIFRTTADGIIVTDNNGIIIMFNEALEKILGYSKEELIGKSTSVLKPEGMKHNNIADEYLTKLFEEGVVTAFEYVYLKKDGRLMDAEVNSSLLKDDKGTVTGSVSSIRDITERKQDENKLRETKEYLDNIIESS